MFTWLVYNSLCALPLAGVALLARRIPRCTPGFEHFLWLLVIVRLVLPPLPFLDRANAQAGPSFVSTADPGLGDQLVAWTTRNFGTNWSNELKLGLTIAFVVLLSFLLLREIRRVLQVDGTLRAAKPSDRLTSYVNRVAERLGVRAPRVRIVPSSGTPFVWSLRGPVLVLPEEQELPDETVLAHELAHIRRFDHVTSWLELLAGALHFWNPIFWIARRRMHLAAELACDSWVVQKFPDRRSSYASALVDALERSTPLADHELVPRAVHAVGVDRENFEERLRHIMRAGGGLRFPRLAGLLALSLVLISLPGLGAPSLAEFRAALPELPQGLDEGTWQRLRQRSLDRLATDPEDGASYSGLGMAYLGLGEFEQAEQAYLKMRELGHEPTKALYNVACVRSRAGDVEGAVDYLLQAEEEGFPALEYALLDPDLEAVRGHPAFSQKPE